MSWIEVCDQARKGCDLAGTCKVKLFLPLTCYLPLPLHQPGCVVVKHPSDRFQSGYKSILSFPQLFLVIETIFLLKFLKLDTFIWDTTQTL